MINYKTKLMGLFDKIFGRKRGKSGLFPASTSDDETRVPQADPTADQGDELSEEERILLAGLGISEETGLQLKSLTRQKIEGLFHQFWADSGKEPVLSGIKSIYRGKDKPYRRLNERKLNANVHFFGCGGYASDKNRYIGVVKTTDRYDLLRIMETDGVNYDVDTEDIINFFKKWEGIVPFLITECEADSVVVQVDGGNASLSAMVAEAVVLCPDLIADEVTPETLDKVLTFIRRSGEIAFWWD